MARSPEGQLLRGVNSMAPLFCDAQLRREGGELVAALQRLAFAASFALHGAFAAPHIPTSPRDVLLPSLVALDDIRAGLIPVPEWMSAQPLQRAQVLDAVHYMPRMPSLALIRRAFKQDLISWHAELCWRSAVHRHFGSCWREWNQYNAPNWSQAPWATDGILK